MENLVRTFGGLVIVKTLQKRQIPDYKTFIGKGKIEELETECKSKGIDLIIFNNNLKALQLFNMEEIFRKHKVKVWDRIDLILKIFEKHAVTEESRLQIELAALRHMGPRIFGMGMQLSRQAGGIGTRGVGETNIEIMKRHLRTLESKINEKLKTINKKHSLHRDSRTRKNLKTVAIVGYTNAGKSQLLNALTKKGVKVKDALFATLDTRIGDLYLPKSRKICLVSDTIGFLQNLPPNLIDSFKSTLDQTIHADLLLHVIDYKDPLRDKKIMIVDEILKDLGVENTPEILVCNKIDICWKLEEREFKKKHGENTVVFISALKRINLDKLVDAIEKNLNCNY